jgi:hypothetical protein
VIQAIADACRVSATIQSDLQEPEIPKESVEQFDEDQELQQVIDGQVCMKVYHFSGILWRRRYVFNARILSFYLLNHIIICQL